MAGRRILDFIPTIIAALVLVAVATMTWEHPHYPFGRMNPYYRFLGTLDWPIFVQTARDFLVSGTVYEQDLSQYWPSAPVYKFPPLFISVLVECFRAGVTEPVLRHDMAVGQLYAYAGSVLFCCLLAARIFSHRSRWLLLTCLVGLFAITFDPFVDTFGRLQLETWILLLCVAALVLEHYRQYVLAGACIGIAAALKVYPLVLVLPFVFTRNTRALLGVVVAIATSLGYSIAQVGMDPHGFYLTAILPQLLVEPVVVNTENLSVAGMLLRAGAPQFASQLAGLLCFGAAFALCLHAVRTQKHNAMLAFAVLVAALVAGMKNSWMNYQLLLVIPVVTTIAVALRRERADVPLLLLLASGLVLVFVGRAYRLTGWEWLFGSMTVADAAVLLRSVASVVILLANLWSYRRWMAEH